MSKIDTPFTVEFTAEGVPRPKQSFKYGKFGGYTPKITKAWAASVKSAAYLAMGQREPYEREVDIAIEFYLPDRRKRDLDNLSKNVLDAMNGIVYMDDRQVVNLLLSKYIDANSPRAVVRVFSREQELRVAEQGDTDG